MTRTSIRQIDSRYELIHPGKASWNWWAGDIGPDGKPATTKNMKYSDLPRNPAPYMLLDAGWADGRDIWRGNVDAGVGALCRSKAQ
jgi:hypothetical protein